MKGKCKIKRQVLFVFLSFEIFVQIPKQLDISFNYKTDHIVIIVLTSKRMLKDYLDTTDIQYHKIFFVMNDLDNHRF